MQGISLISIVLQGESCENDTIWAQKPKSWKLCARKLSVLQVPVAIYVVLREQFDRSCSQPLISKCQHGPIQFAFQCMRESSQKKVIKVCVDDHLAQWHENQKKLALLWVWIHNRASSKMLLSRCFVCIFVKFIDRGTLGVEG